MASSSYGRQFELMMTEISFDLVKGLFSERGIDFGESDMDYIRGFFNTPGDATFVSVSVEKVPPVATKKPKPKAKAKGKAAEPESPSGFSE
jgi:hypothetical protein